MNTFTLDTMDALVVVDLQNDFLAGGALQVPGANAIIPCLNSYIDIFSSKSLAIVASRDFHPPDHSSFTTQGGPWPVHCVAGKPGAEFPAELHLPNDAIIISKGTRQDKEAYSAFSGTNLEQQLKKHCLARLFIGGLATDYCVLQTVTDAISLGFEVVVLEDAVCAVNLNAGDGSRALLQMHTSGAETASLQQFNCCLSIN